MTVLSVRRFAAESVDAYGNAEAVWADPVEWPVWGIAPGDMAEPSGPVRDQNRDASVVEWTVFAPATGCPGERDRVIVDGVEFEVDGRPNDWTRGPWRPAPGMRVGVTVALKRVEG